MRFPHCQNEQTVKTGTAKLQDQSQQQQYLCRGCNRLTSSIAAIAELFEGLTATNGEKSSNPS